MDKHGDKRQAKQPEKIFFIFNGKKESKEKREDNDTKKRMRDPAVVFQVNRPSVDPCDIVNIRKYRSEDKKRYELIGFFF
jgi:hypothetical protein